MKLKLSHKLYSLIAIPLVFELIFVTVLIGFVTQSEVEARYHKKVSAIAETAESIHPYPGRIQSCVADYIHTRNEGYIAKYRKLAGEMHDKIARLKELTAGNPEQGEHIKEVEHAEEVTVQTLNEFIDSLKSEGPDVAILRLQRMSMEFFPVVQNAQSHLVTLIAEQKVERDKILKSESNFRSTMMTLILVGMGFNIMVAILLAVVFQRGMLRRLSLVMENTERLATGRSLHLQVEGADEIASLDHVFHEMAGVLTNAQRKERAIIEHARDVICSLDAEGRFTKVSPAALDLWGVSPDELIGTYVIELVYPEDTGITMDLLRGTIRKPLEKPLEIRMRRHDGSMLFTLWSAHWSELDKSLFCVVHDITERKLVEDAIRENEARVRFILENMPIGVVVLTADGVMEIVNPAMEETFGYTNDELIGRHVVSLFPPSEDGKDVPAYTEDLYSKAIGHIYEREAERKNGNKFPIHISITEFDFLDGKRFLAIVLDVTERHEIERFKQEFLGVVSHELRTPLTSIRGSMKLMLVGALGPLSEQAQKALTIAERSATRLIGLVNDLLDMEKLEAGKMEMHFESIAIAPVIESSVESVKAFAEQHEVTIEVKGGEGTVFGDSDRLVQVLVNLLSNAIKYSPKGGTATVSVVQHDEEVEVRISDRGRGIPKTHVGALFQRFKQVERTDATKKGGTGLGLVICKAIIEQHLGTIGVESELGEGSTFWFRVPSKDKSQPQAAKSLVRDGSEKVEEKKTIVAHSEII